MVLRPFQKRFVKGALAPGIDVSALSIPRGQGKTWLAAYLLERGLTPGDPLHVPSGAYVLCAASLEQARLCFRFVRATLEPRGGYVFTDASNRIGIRHTASKAELRVMSSNAKGAFGLVNVPLIVGDEPGAWETLGGEMMNDAIVTALGKPGSPMRAVFIGTLAPAMAGWWHDLVKAGSTSSTYVQALRGNPDKWAEWKEIKRVNPLTAISPELRRRLKLEREEARGDSRLKARFLSYRLNVPSGDESTMLLTVDDWARVVAREVPPRAGKPIVGVDLGAGRAFSAAVAIYRNGRTECLALCPGIPSVEEQEKRDRVSAGSYEKLVSAGLLHVADGLRVQPPAMLVDLIADTWGPVAGVVADRFRISDLADAGLSGLEPRMTRWSESSEDIRALRKMAKDGPLAVDPGSAALLEASLSVASVKSDDSGNVRLQKRGSNNQSRDDVAAALTIGAGGAPEAHQVHKGRRGVPWKGGLISGRRDGVGSGGISWPAMAGSARCVERSWGGLRLTTWCL